MKKIIAFSLWGNDPKYTIGAIRNAQLATIHYPDWTCRFYLEKDAGTDIISDLSQLGAEVLINATDRGSWHGMFWRFEPASETDVDVFISRDCDSRLSAREAAAVEQWIKSPYLVHSMADHPYHFHPGHGLMGGMFGMKTYACPQMKEMITQFKYKYPDAWQCDQSFLRDYVFPLVAHKIFATSDIHPRCNPFPLPRVNGTFVGEIRGPNEEILHPEHRAIRNNAI